MTAAYDPTLLLAIINQITGNIVNIIEQFGILGFQVAILLIVLYFVGAVMRGIADVIYKKE